MCVLGEVKILMKGAFAQGGVLVEMRVRYSFLHVVREAA